MIFTVDDSAVNTVSHLIQLSVAPVFLIAGVAAILGVFSQRLGRIIDKVDKINTELLQLQRESALGERATSVASEARVRDLEIQRAYLERRSRNMNIAILFCTMTGFLVASVIMILFLSSFFSFSGGLAIAALFTLGMTTFMLALSLFLREIYMATNFMKIRR